MRYEELKQYQKWCEEKGFWNRNLSVGMSALLIESFREDQMDMI